MNVNPEKFAAIAKTKYTLDTDGNRVTSEKSVKVLDIHIGHKLSFD